MRILNIEESAFELMMARFEALAQKVEQLCSNAGDKRAEKWLDATDVCFCLISRNDSCRITVIAVR